MRAPPDAGNPPDSDSDSLAAEESKRGGIEALQTRLDRYAKARERARSMAAFLRTLDTRNVVDATTGQHQAVQGTTGEHLGLPPTLADLHQAEACADRMECCGEWLAFRHYLVTDELRLVAAQFCQLSKLCPLCAIRRASRNLGAYLERFHQVTAEEPHLLAYMVTLTVKNGPDLNERMSHLRGAVRRLVDRRRQALAGNGWGRTEFRKVAGAVGSYEVSNIGNGWHPHLHLVALASEPLDVRALVAEWQRSTKDSFIVDVRPLTFGEEGPAEAFCEVFKYAMKFQKLGLADNWRAHLDLRGKRLLVSFGCFLGVAEPELLTDLPLEDEPFVELFFRYLADSSAYTYERRGETDPAAVAAGGPKPPARPPLIRQAKTKAEILAGVEAARERFNQGATAGTSGRSVSDAEHGAAAAVTAEHQS